MDQVADPLASHSDEALLRLYAQGDAQAAALLLDRFAPRLQSFATRLLGNRAEAEEVVQDTMLRLWQIAPEWRTGGAKPSSWLFQVARNLCIDRLRRQRTVMLDDISEPADDRPGAEVGLMTQQRLAALDHALQQLPERQRAAVVLRHIEGMANPEIAEILDITVEAVESLTARGKRALSATLARRKEELGL